MWNIGIYVSMDFFFVVYCELSGSGYARLQASFWLQGQPLPFSSLCTSSVGSNLMAWLYKAASIKAVKI